MKKHKCPCCGYYTLETREEYEICGVCFWEDDPGQRKDETDSGGANQVSLVRARENFLAFGACEEDMLPHVRRPNPDELTGIDG